MVFAVTVTSNLPYSVSKCSKRQKQKSGRNLNTKLIYLGLMMAEGLKLVKTNMRAGVNIQQCGFNHI